jgi:alpha-1,2-mannosyltransferase
MDPLTQETVPAVEARRRFLTMYPAWLLVGAATLGYLPFLVVTFIVWIKAGSTGVDSWVPMRYAWEWFAQPHAGTIYQKLFIEFHLKFQYPPSSLLIFAVPEYLHLRPTDRALNLIGWSSVLLEGLAAAGVAHKVFRSESWTKMTRSNRILWLTLIGLLGIVFTPVIHAYVLGQVQTWLNAWFVVACLLWVLDRRLAAGAAIGAICLFKPQLGLFLIWALLRGEKKFLAGWAMVVVPGEILALSIFGLPNHLDYLNALRFMAMHGEGLSSNQTVNGLLNRLLGNVSEGNSFPAYNHLIYVCTLVSSAVLVIATMVYRMRSKATNFADFLIAAVTFTLASPIAWDHHFGILPPCFVALLALVMRMPVTAKRNVCAWLLAICYVLTAFPIREDWFAATGWGSLGLAGFFFGVVGILSMLYWLRDDAGLMDVGEPVGL